MRTDPLLFQTSTEPAFVKRDTLRDAGPPIQAPLTSSGVDLPLSTDHTPPMGGPLVELAPRAIEVTPMGPPVRLTPRGLAPSGLGPSGLTPRGLGPVVARLEDAAPRVASDAKATGTTDLDAELLARSLDDESAERKKKDFLTSSGENARLKAAVLALEDARPRDVRIEEATSDVATLRDLVPVVVAPKKQPESERKEFATAALADSTVVETRGPKVDVSKVDPRQALTERALRAVEGPKGKRARAREDVASDAPAGRRSRLVLVGAVALVALSALALIAARARSRGAESTPGSSTPSMTSQPAQPVSSLGGAATTKTSPESSPLPTAPSAGEASAASEADATSQPSAAPAAANPRAKPLESAAPKSNAPADSASAVPPSEFYGATPPKTSPEHQKPKKNEFYE